MYSLSLNWQSPCRPDPGHCHPRPSPRAAGKAPHHLLPGIDQLCSIWPHPRPGHRTTIAFHNHGVLRWQVAFSLLTAVKIKKKNRIRSRALLFVVSPRCCPCAHENIKFFKQKCPRSTSMTTLPELAKFRSPDLAHLSARAGPSPAVGGRGRCGRGRPAAVPHRAAGAADRPHVSTICGKNTGSRFAQFSCFRFVPRDCCGMPDLSAKKRHFPQAFPQTQLLLPPATGIFPP